MTPEQWTAVKQLLMERKGARCFQCGGRNSLEMRFKEWYRRKPPSRVSMEMFEIICAVCWNSPTQEDLRRAQRDREKQEFKAKNKRSKIQHVEGIIRNTLKKGPAPDYKLHSALRELSMRNIVLPTQELIDECAVLGIKKFLKYRPEYR